MPTVSILMSVYNGERYLLSAVESVLGQTFSNWEFIIINDASTDTSASILNRYAQKDKRFKIITNVVNLGLTKSLNVGLSHCSGQFIARLDVDDCWSEEKLQKQIDYLNAHPAISVCGSQGWYLSDNGDRIGEKNLPLSSAAIKTKLLFNNQLIHSSWLARASALKEMNGYNPEFKYSQDYELLLRLAGAGHSLGNVSERLVGWRVRPDSLSWSNKRQEWAAIKARWYAITRHHYPKIIGLFYIFLRLVWMGLPQSLKRQRYA